MAMGIKTLQLMKIRLTTLLIVLCSTLVTTAVFGQTVYTWIGSADVPFAIDDTNNWTPASTVAPSPAVGDTAQWDVTSGNITLTYSNNTPSFSGNPGINFILTANENNLVDFTYLQAGSSGNYGLNNVTVTGPGGAFALGDSSANVLNIVPRPNGATHDFVNNSANPAIIYPNVRWQAGGGAV